MMVDGWLFSWFFCVMISKMTFRYLPGPDGHVILQICSMFNLFQKSWAMHIKGRSCAGVSHFEPEP